MTRKNQYVETKSDSNIPIASYSELSETTKKINKATLNIDAFDIIPVYIMILNGSRQIIYVNKLFRDTFRNCNELTGKKVGEAINCIQSETECKSKYCQTCGLMNTIIESETSGFALGESVYH